MQKKTKQNTPHKNMVSVSNFLEVPTYTKLLVIHICTKLLAVLTRTKLPVVLVCTQVLAVFI